MTDRRFKYDVSFVVTSVLLQDVLYGSETQASLYLCNLVEGTYLFHLRVTDAQGRSSFSTATVEVRPGEMEPHCPSLSLCLCPVLSVSLLCPSRTWRRPAGGAGVDGRRVSGQFVSEGNGHQTVGRAAARRGHRHPRQSFGGTRPSEVNVPDRLLIGFLTVY